RAVPGCLFVVVRAGVPLVDQQGGGVVVDADRPLGPGAEIRVLESPSLELQIEPPNLFEPPPWVGMNSFSQHPHGCPRRPQQVGKVTWLLEFPGTDRPFGGGEARKDAELIASQLCGGGEYPISQQYIDIALEDHLGLWPEGEHGSIVGRAQAPARLGRRAGNVPPPEPLAQSLVSGRERRVTAIIEQDLVYRLHALVCISLKRAFQILGVSVLNPQHTPELGAGRRIFQRVRTLRRRALVCTARRFSARNRIQEFPRERVLRQH